VDGLDDMAAGVGVYGGQGASGGVFGNGVSARLRGCTGGGS